MKKSVMSLLCACVLSFTASSALAKPIVLKGGTSVSDKVWQNVIAQKWADLVTERSNGEIIVENYSNALLGSDNAMGEKTIMGGLQWYYTSTSNLSRMVKEMATFELPYLIENEDDTLKLFYPEGTLGGPIVEDMQKVLAKKNLRLIYVGRAMFRAVINGNKEIRLPNDSKGLKIRVTASDLERESVKSWNGAPVPMNFGEVYTALQQGTIDGLNLSPAEAFPMKFHEVCSYAVENKFNAYAAVILMNLDTWHSLSDEQRKLISDAADDAVRYDHANKEAMYDDVYNAELVKNGMQIITPTAEEMAIWKKTTVDTVWPLAIGKYVKQEWVDLWEKMLGK